MSDKLVQIGTERLTAALKGKKGSPHITDVNGRITSMGRGGFISIKDVLAGKLPEPIEAPVEVEEEMTAADWAAYLSSGPDNPMGAPGASAADHFAAKQKFDRISRRGSVQKPS